jgi:hypothetical protein
MVEKGRSLFKKKGDRPSCIRVSCGAGVPPAIHLQKKVLISLYLADRYLTSIDKLIGLLNAFITA